MVPIDLVRHLKVLGGQLTETLQFLAFQLIQPGADMVGDVLQLLGDLAALKGE